MPVDAAGSDDQPARRFDREARDRDSWSRAVRVLDRGRVPDAFGRDGDVVVDAIEDLRVNDPALAVQAVEEVRENRAGLEIGGGREILRRDIGGLGEALQECK